jgi:hypothetical protein
MQDTLATGGMDALVVQLGDLGSGATSGSPEAFEAARRYLEGFGCQYSLILGALLQLCNCSALAAAMLPGCLSCA